METKKMKIEYRKQIDSETASWQLLTNIDELLWNGVYYTQNIENLPIEERIFFKEGKGVTATNEYYRPASSIELNDWAEYKKQQESIEVI